jgi:hypothetical protein
MPQTSAGVAHPVGAGAASGVLARAALSRSNLGGKKPSWHMHVIGKGIVGDQRDGPEGCYAAESCGVAEFLRESNCCSAGENGR